jgi:hypothetical protein
VIAASLARFGYAAFRQWLVAGAARIWADLPDADGPLSVSARETQANVEAKYCFVKASYGFNDEITSMPKALHFTSAEGR